MCLPAPPHNFVKSVELIHLLSGGHTSYQSPQYYSKSDCVQIYLEFSELSASGR